MDENITSASILAVKKGAFGSSYLLSSMVIFTDFTYLLIAGIGGFVSMGSAYYDLIKLRREKEEKGEECIKSAFMELSKASGIGALFTLLSFMLLVSAGGDAMERLTGLTWFDKMMPSFWLVLTVAFATEAVTIWEKAKKKIAKRFT